MAELPADWTPPPRSIVSIKPVPPEQGGGILIGCDCGTSTHLIIEDPEKLTGVQEEAFTCGGCNSVTWFKVGPLGQLDGEAPRR